MTVHYVEHGTGMPVLVLHGAGVDHREAEAGFEPVLQADFEGAGMAANRASQWLVQVGRSN